MKPATLERLRDEITQGEAIAYLPDEKEREWIVNQVWKKVKKSMKKMESVTLSMAPCHVPPTPHGAIDAVKASNLGVMG